MTTTFRKNTELCKKRGYDMELLKTAIHLLETGRKVEHKTKKIGKKLAFRVLFLYLCIS